MYRGKFGQLSGKNLAAVGVNLRNYFFLHGVQIYSFVHFPAIGGGFAHFPLLVAAAFCRSSQSQMASAARLPMVAPLPRFSLMSLSWR